MLKNSFKHIAAGLTMYIFYSATCQAQSLGEMAEAAKLRQLNGAGIVSQAALGINGNEPQIEVGRISSRVDYDAMIVTSIFTSKDRNQAGISIGGEEIFIGPGDMVVKNWIVDSITMNTVILKRCTTPKRCETKKINYTLTR